MITNESRLGRTQHKLYSYDAIRGLVSRAKAHRVLSLVDVYNAEQAGIKTDGAPWVVKCEHGTMIAMDTLPKAKWSASKPDAWCSKCQEKFIRLQDMRDLRSGIMTKQIVTGPVVHAPQSLYSVPQSAKA